LPGLAQAATIITNGGFGVDGQPLPTNYGDRLTSSDSNFTVTAGGTPNVVVDYQVRAPYPNDNNATGSFLTSTNFPTGQGGAVQLVDDVDTDNRFFVVFTPDPGYAVQLDSWDVLEAPGGGNTYFGWAIHPLGDYIGTYASGDESRLSFEEDDNDLGGRANISVEILASVGQTLVLSITPANNTGSVAIDNITFSQVRIPEPATAGLVVLGLGAMGLYRRRA
jgi:hypothetical protein